MQKDFHFYAIYTLCRLSGLKREESKIIAYSSQHTDDAKYFHAINFENGGRFQQGMSAHRFLTLKVFRKEVGYDIFVPFHFLPGGEGNCFWEKMLCRQNSEISKIMISETLKSVKKPSGLHRLGISLHVYADTWAHQNFCGMKHSINNVTNLRDETNNEFEYLGQYLPELGHANANKFPDIPYLEWGYDEQREVINNTERFIDAANSIYKILSNDLRNQIPMIYEREPVAWEYIVEKLNKTFLFVGSLDERIAHWEKSIESGFFGLNEKIRYDDREWFYSAIEVQEQKPFMINTWNSYKNSQIMKGKSPFNQYRDSNKYIRLEDFKTSNWKYFHDALLEHRYFLKHQLLPQYEIFI